jgi:hypothetical protein
VVAAADCVDIQQDARTRSASYTTWGAVGYHRPALLHRVS